MRSVRRNATQEKASWNSTYNALESDYWRYRLDTNSSLWVVEMTAKREEGQIELTAAMPRVMDQLPTMLEAPRQPIPEEALLLTQRMRGKRRDSAPAEGAEEVDADVLRNLLSETGNNQLLIPPRVLLINTEVVRNKVNEGRQIRQHPKDGQFSNPHGQTLTTTFLRTGGLDRIRRRMTKNG